MTRGIRQALIAPVHARRATAALSEASPACRFALDRLLQQTQSSGERDVLLKAIGARRGVLETDASTRDLSWLADHIRGKSDAWLQKHTRGALPSLTPFGCVSSTCASAWLDSDSVEAVRTNRSPLHRLAAALTHEYTSFIAARGPTSPFAWVALQAAASCVQLLTGHSWKNGGPMSLETSPTPPGCALGVTYHEVPWIEPAERTIDLNALERTVRDGYDVFASIIILSNDKTNYRSHMVLLTGCDTALGKRVWHVYDSGQLRSSYDVSDADLEGSWRGNDQRFVASLSVPTETA